MTSNSDKVRLSSLFTPREVVTDLRATSKEEAVCCLVDRLAETGRIVDRKAVLSAVTDRESLGSTVVGQGVAIPHAHLDDLEQMALAVGISPEGLPFDAQGEHPVHLVILILVPQSKPGAYLQAVAAIAKCCSDWANVKAIASLRTAEDVWASFDTDRAALPGYVSARDMMRSEYMALKQTDTLKDAIDLFYQHGVLDIPIVDEDGAVVGVITEDEVLKLSLPQYLLWLDDVSTILQFEPFAETLKNESATKLADIMSKRYFAVQEDTPAIEVARILMRREVNKVLVTRKNRLVGVILLGDLLAKILRG